MSAHLRLEIGDFRLTPQLEWGYYHGAMAILVISYTILDFRIENE